MGDAIIPNDWTGEYCKFSVCWPNSPQWLGVLRGVLSIPAEGRFWEEASGTITEAQEIIQQTFSYNFKNEEVLMSCSDNVSNSLLAIANALANGGGGGGGGGGACGCVSFTDRSSNVQIQATITLSDDSMWPIFASGPLPELPGAGYPDGYTGESQYDADKCAKATKIIGDLIVSLSNMAALNLGVGAIGALVVLGCLVGLIVVPQATIPLLLFAMVGNVGITTALGLLANYIDENRADFVCILYEEDNLESMIGLLADALDIAIAAISVTGALAVAVKSIALWLLNGDTLGVLLTSDAKLLYPEADCSACLCSWTLDTGTLVSGELTGDFTIASVSVTAGGTTRERIWVYSPSGCPCQNVAVSTSGWSTPPAGTGSGYIDCTTESFGPPGPSGNGIVTDPGLSFGDICVFNSGGYILLQSTDPFEATFTMGGDCEPS